MLTWILFVGGLWAAIVLLAWVFQERMIYLPDTSAPGDPVGFEVEPVSFVTDDGLELEGWALAHPDPLAWVVVANGNAGNRAHRLPMADGLLARGYSVLLFDYRGYGGNPGRPDADGVRADMHAAARWLNEHVEPDHVVYLGESIGSAVAAATAATLPPDALVLRSPFTTLADVGRRHYPFLPVRTLLRDHHDTQAALEEVEAPVLVVAGGSDRIVPTDLSRRVARDAGASYVEISGVGHNDPALFIGDEFLDAVDEFVRGVVSGGGRESNPPGDVFSPPRRL